MYRALSNSIPSPAAIPSLFSRWALDDARTADERYLIFLVREETRVLEYNRLPLEARGRQRLERADHRLFRELNLNPLKMPPFNAADRRCGASAGVLSGAGGGEAGRL